MLKRICDHPALLSKRMAKEVGAAGTRRCRASVSCASCVDACWQAVIMSYE